MAMFGLFYEKCLNVLKYFFYFQEILAVLSTEEKEVFREAFSKFDKDGSGNISTKVK